MKRIISLILSFVMVLALVPFSALNVGAEAVIDNVVYTLSDDGTYYIVAETLESVTSVTIPDKINGLPIKEIGYEAFYDCDSLTSVEMGNFVTTIGDYAFYRCYSLTSIEMGNSVTTIGDYAFYNCSSLTSVEIPNFVTTIGNSAFYSCDSLTSIEIPENAVLGTDVIDGCSSLPYTEYENIKYYGSESNPYQIAYEPTFSSLSSYTLHPQTKQLAGGLFYKCSKLTSIEIPNSVTTIGSDAFAWCSSLTSVEIPNSVTTIGDSAFSSCSRLTSIEIPNSVTTIGDDAFCSCSNLTSVEIPNSVTTIGDDAFSSCDSLTSIEIPNSVTTIGDDAFYSCDSLTSIEIPNSVTTIGDEAFKYCSSLTSIEIPNSVTTIGSDAFAWCENLTDIYCEAESQPEGWAVEYYDEWGWYVGGWDSGCYADIHWGVYLCDYDSPLYFSLSEDKTYCIVIDCNKSATSVVIPDEINGLAVKEIGDGAFSSCDSLTSVEIPNSVTTIGSDAFAWCENLTDIYCEAESQPEGWADGYYDEWGWYVGCWYSGCNATIHWGVHLCNGEGEWLSNSTNHWRLCSCGKEMDIASHNYEWIVTIEPQIGVPGEQKYTCKTCDYVSKTEIIPELEIAIGDIDGDGAIGSMDYLYLKRAYFSQYPLSDIAIGDIDGDGSISSMDYLYLKRAYFSQYVIG